MADQYQINQQLQGGQYGFPQYAYAANQMGSLNYQLPATQAIVGAQNEVMMQAFAMPTLMPPPVGAGAVPAGLELPSGLGSSRIGLKKGKGASAKKKAKKDPKKKIKKPKKPKKKKPAKKKVRVAGQAPLHPSLDLPPSTPERQRQASLPPWEECGAESMTHDPCPIVAKNACPSLSLPPSLSAMQCPMQPFASAFAFD